MFIYFWCQKLKKLLLLLFVADSMIKWEFSC
jgi:hypothetical protein